MWQPAGGDGRLEELWQAVARARTELREANKRMEWLEAELWRLTKKVDGNGP